mmetsp:Transcript_577/g.1668  ORF Transcript_577/g.1668 Transcript_577/m.1668 type:complete len:202 (-) Transcript_577:1615-2220(-)
MAHDVRGSEHVHRLDRNLCGDGFPGSLRRYDGRFLFVYKGKVEDQPQQTVSDGDDEAQHLSRRSGGDGGAPDRLAPAGLSLVGGRTAGEGVPRLRGRQNSIHEASHDLPSCRSGGPRGGEHRSEEEEGEAPVQALGGGRGDEEWAGRKDIFGRGRELLQARRYPERAQRPVLESRRGADDVRDRRRRGGACRHCRQRGGEE